MYQLAQNSYFTENSLLTGSSGGPFQVDASLSPSTTSASSSTASSSMGYLGAMGAISSIIGGIGSAFGTYYSAKSISENLKFQSDIAAINARMAENTAQAILSAGDKAIGQVGLKAGKVKGSQRASMAARGLVLGEGSAAEEIATTDLMKETDMMTINANAVRQAWAVRTQGANYQNESLMKGTTADSISPISSAATSLMNSATDVASSWYKYKRLGRLADLMGVE